MGNVKYTFGLFSLKMPVDVPEWNPGGLFSVFSGTVCSLLVKVRGDEGPIALK